MINVNFDKDEPYIFKFGFKRSIDYPLRFTDDGILRIYFPAKEGEKYSNVARHGLEPDYSKIDLNTPKYIKHHQTEEKTNLQDINECCKNGPSDNHYGCTFLSTDKYDDFLFVDYCKNKTPKQNRKGVCKKTTKQNRKEETKQLKFKKHSHLTFKNGVETKIKIKQQSELILKNGSKNRKEKFVRSERLNYDGFDCGFYRFDYGVEELYDPYFIPVLCDRCLHSVCGCEQ